ncbi:BRO-N domain-containing protein [Billgrantia aerodenitrificans]|uniref:Bro-N domain-containing protein n=1 Tax=Billgrantia aerodenitrificans TaxID=2733483 RepID=A0ABS9AP93_9GAMM|nr:BRO family protein [Halomonas aerodenitrificans]MCE8023653.1 hypothetical protein [Halomonas aerodenitrificans]
MQEMQPLATPFLFQQAEVRTATDDQGEAWFCAKDVFDALGISWKGGAGLRNLPETWKVVLYLRTSYGTKETYFISEAAVYRTTFRSNKPEAIEFANWVCSEVLPAIRKQGFFGHVPQKDRLAFSRQITAITRDLMRCRNAFQQSVLLGELRDLYRLVGKPLPGLSLIGQQPDQIPLL